MKDSNQTLATKDAPAEKSPEHQCIDELLTFAVLHADRYKRDAGETTFHPVHAELIDRACRLIGREPLSKKFEDKPTRRWVGDFSFEVPQ